MTIKISLYIRLWLLLMAMVGRFPVATPVSGGEWDIFCLAHNILFDVSINDSFSMVTHCMHALAQYWLQAHLLG